LSKEERIRKLTLLLKELFQFENNDLDFGIYRIINIKRKEISEFIDTELFEIIKEKIKTVEDNAELQKNLESLKKEIENTFGCDIIEAKKKYAETPKVKDYVDKEKEFKLSEKESDIEEEIYDDVISFFSRYYDNGDFISKKRYSKDSKYAIPYNGEEVYLYWANNDQYYIKTAENFSNYSFKVGSIKVDFEITSEEVDVEKNNIKDAEKKFFIFYDADYDQSNKVVNVKFGYRGLTEDEENTILNLSDKKRLGKDEVNVYNLKKINEKIAIYGLSELQNKHIKMDGSKSDSSEIKWHLNKYSTKNTSDYFIHKNLRKFLKQELDFYIKNELLHVDDIDTNENLNINLKRVKVFKEISLKIIEFLAQIEDFQKKLWEKKKFVISTDYCITLDYIDEKYYPLILKNEKQMEEWNNLYAFDIDLEVKKLRGTLTVHGKNDEEKMIEVLKQNPSLVIDTKFYDKEFKYQILSELDNLDENTTGILINSDNFQALNLLSNKYVGKIKCCYIDPPFNAKSTEIIYKNTYKNSSWNTLIENRLQLIKNILPINGIIEVAIDDYETHSLRFILDNIFENNRLGTIAVVHNPGGRSDDKFIATAHEYLYVYCKNQDDADIYFLDLDENQISNYDKEDEFGKYREESFRRSGSNSRRVDRPNLYYPIYLNPETLDIDVEKKNGYSETILPIDPKGVERCWRWNSETLIERKEKSILVKKTSSGYLIKVKARLEIDGVQRGIKPKTIWNKPSYASSTGTILLNEMFGNPNFTFPKSLSLVEDSIKIMADKNDTIIDFFAGSGTAGHAVLKLNKKDTGKRKFILIEMGQYFDTVLKPRILKAIYSDNWKAGKPIDNIGSKRQIIKYQILEQNEDSLNNIDFKEPAKIAKESKDYNIKYMLEYETRQSNVFLNLSDLNNPFNYKLKVEIDNQIKEVDIDLIETFNYIAGIEIQSFLFKNNGKVNYIVVKGKRNEKDILVIWRNKTDDFDPNHDKKFVKEEFLNEEYDEIYINGDSLIEGAKSIDEIIKGSLFRR